MTHSSIRHHSTFFTLLILLILTLLLGACVLVDPPTPRSGEMPGEAFKQVYEDLGGVEVVGPCISPQFEKNGIAYQYTQKMLMVYNPNASPSMQYTLGEIGYYINLELSALPDNGYDIWDEVDTYYKKTGGIVGKALTIVLRNEEKQRYEQYYEGAAFYRSYTDPAGNIKLMDYGEWMCGAPCQAFGDAAPAPTPIAKLQNDEPATQTIRDYAMRLGGVAFTGQPISTSAYLAPDGAYEMVYENLIFATNPQVPGSVFLRPLPYIMGFAADPPVKCEPLPDYLCYSVTQELVYMVPTLYYDYILQHGGFELIGAPITALHAYPGGASYQCYENLCLIFTSGAPEDLQVSVMQLGIDYSRQTSGTSTPSEPAKTIIETWPRYAILPNGQSQEIWIQAIEGTTPIPGVLFSLSFVYPDGSQITEELFPLTDINGQSFYTLKPITAPEGTTLAYTACYLEIRDQPICINGSFIIWSSAP